MQITINPTKGYSQLLSDNIFFDDIWFSVVKIVIESIAEVIYYYGTVNTSRKRFFLFIFGKTT